MDQDETWHASRPRPWPHCVRWGPSFSSPKGHSPQFSAYICCSQMARWIKMPIGRQVGICPDDIVLNGNLAPLPKRGQPTGISGSCLLWLNGWIDQDGTWHGCRPRPRPHCARWGPSFPPNRGTVPNFRPIYCGQTVAHLSYC